MSFLKSIGNMFSKASHYVEKKIENTAKHVASDLKKAEKTMHRAVHQVEKRVEHAAKEVKKDVVHISREAKEAFHHAEKKVEQVVKHATHHVKKAEKAVYRAVHQVEKRVEHAAKEVKKDVVHISREAREAFHHAEKKAEQVVKHATHHVKKAEKAVHRAVHQIEKRVERAAKEVAKDAGHIGHKAKEVFQHAEKKAEQAVQHVAHDVKKAEKAIHRTAHHIEHKLGHEIKALAKTADRGIHKIEQKAEHIAKQTVHDIIHAGEKVEQTARQVAKNAEKSWHGLTKHPIESTVEFVRGAGEAALQDVTYNLAHRPYHSPHPVAYEWGQMTGHAVSTVAGVVETAGSIPLAAAGIALSGTGVGAAIGAPATAIAVAGATHGATLATTGSSHFVQHANELYQRMSRSEGESGKAVKGAEQARKFTKEELATKPKNSPDPDKWQKKGGKITIDENGTWTYHDWEGNSVTYLGGYPDFKGAGMVKQEVQIGKFESYDKDFAKADKLAPNGPIDRDVSTWHHHQDETTMQEMDRILHSRFTHRGGMSKTKKRNKQGDD
ncbi:hypothetical protein EP10_000103 [Geobacillus icigianus]|uniref:Uncharacterized protein n=3 Tax=Anoxybacillaceae TaxID=3120669 RepID=A0ABU6BC51_9BACL|nr:hypothetical protein [Geobacillus icigianus]